MSKSAKPAHKKPAEIGVIEKAYGIELKYLSLETTERFGPYRNNLTYSVNKAGKVTHLMIMDLCISDLSPLLVLKDLANLICNRNLVKDISILGKLKALDYLNLGNNGITDLSPLAGLMHLKELVIYNNPIEDVSSITELKNLRNLYCQNLGIQSLDFLIGLDKLEILDASGNQLTDLTVLTRLPGIKHASFEENNIKDLSSIQNLDHPISLDVSENQLRHIPSSVMRYFDWELYPDEATYSGDIEDADQLLLLWRNPLQFPPSSVIDLGKEALQNYYATAERFGHAPLSEGRIIVVGDGASGKSSLIERLLYDQFHPGKGQTNGISIEHWKIPHADGRELIFNIWDFGGQEVQHAVHKFFFTSGCLYVLVLDNRKEEEPEYWLQQIESLGGSAPVLVVFNKQDENATEVADRKYLVQKYRNIVGFYNTSCKTGAGIQTFSESLKKAIAQLNTVDEQFPNNWFTIKKAIEARTSGAHNYLDYQEYSEICEANAVADKSSQTLLLKYFTTIGAVTWFGDTYLNLLHVLSPAWISQGVYKIITGKKTAAAFGKINIRDFAELLQPTDVTDYTYAGNHFAYILSMMKKFDLCYTPDDKEILIPSAFAKEPRVEYTDFKGEKVRTYIFQFKDYMPMALIHRFTAKKLAWAYDNNYWYSGIVLKDSKGDTLAMVQADKEAKRIYARIKGESKLGLWEYIRREMDEIVSSYAKIPFEELVLLDESTESTVNYDDLISHIKANKSIYFHPKLLRDFNVGYLMGLFEEKEQTLEKLKNTAVLGEWNGNKGYLMNPTTLIVNILNNNSPTVNTSINNQVNIDIDIHVVQNTASELKGETDYLLNELGNSNTTLREALQKIMEFAGDAKTARNSDELREKGWGRRLKNIIKTIADGGEQLKHIQDGGEALRSMIHKIGHLASIFHLSDVLEYIHQLFK